MRAQSKQHHALVAVVAALMFVCATAVIAPVGDECVPATECVPGSNTCSDNADCSETDAGYTCACKDGFLDTATDENPDNAGRECVLPCPDGYGPARLGDLCLRVSTDVASNWVAARDACRADFGDLVSMHSAEDAQVVADTVKSDGLTPNFWIGLNDRDAEGTYEWSDGTPFDYASWLDGQPNNSGGQDAGAGTWAPPPHIVARPCRTPGTPLTLRVHAHAGPVILQSAWCSGSQRFGMIGTRCAPELLAVLCLVAVLSTLGGGALTDPTATSVCPPAVRPCKLRLRPASAPGGVQVWPGRLRRARDVHGDR